VNDSDWDRLLACTVFLPPATIEGLAERYGNAILFPPTLRGTIAIFPEAKGQRAKREGFPVFAGGAWHSLWGMRPSRIACNVARGLGRGDGESDKHPVVCCTNGRRVEWPSWTPHHVYGFERLKRDAAALNALRFSNTANLVLTERSYHRTKHSVLDTNPVAAWLRYIISKLYPKGGASPRAHSRTAARFAGRVRRKHSRRGRRGIAAPRRTARARTRRQRARHPEVAGGATIRALAVDTAQ
jgi:hypothetical protein